MSNGSTFVRLPCWTNNVRQFDPSLSLRKINEDYLNERDDYGVPFSEQQYMHGSCYISWFKCKSFDQSDPSEWPQILDIYSVAVL